MHDTDVVRIGRRGRSAARGLFSAALCVASLALTACGASIQTKTVTVAEQQASSVAATAEATPAQSTSKRTSRSTKRSAPAGRTWCDSNIRVRAATTTCRFAENVFLAYWMSQNYDGAGSSAYSPAAGRAFALSCGAGKARVTCTAGDGAEIVFSRAALARYSLAQAKRYVAAHDVGDEVLPWDATSEGSGSSSGDGSSCDPSYEGACLDPNASDYDCAGGSGDGPEYTGTVSVVGDDHYDLDRNGDGTGCE